MEEDITAKQMRPLYQFLSSVNPGLAQRMDKCSGLGGRDGFYA
jgi:hypothetical protein